MVLRKEKNSEIIISTELSCLSAEKYVTFKNMETYGSLPATSWSASIVSTVPLHHLLYWEHWQSCRTTWQHACSHLQIQKMTFSITWPPCFCFTFSLPPESKSREPDIYLEILFLFPFLLLLTSLWNWISICNSIHQLVFVNLGFL